MLELPLLLRIAALEQPRDQLHRIEASWGERRQVPADEVGGITGSAKSQYAVVSCRAPDFGDGLLPELGDFFLALAQIEVRGFHLVPGFLYPLVSEEPLVPEDRVGRLELVIHFPRRNGGLRR